MVRVAYLGPAGTFSEQALREAGVAGTIEPLPMATIHDAIIAVDRGEAERALVPFENSTEGSVRATLDTLAFDAPTVTIVGEHDQPITNSLIAREEIELGKIEVVVSHPQANAQCRRFLRTELPQAEVRAASSTADAVREVAESERPLAALGASSAAVVYGCVVLREGVEDEAGNVTRFVWLAPGGTESEGAGPWRTTLIFSELGADHPGALVEALTEFSSRDVNLTRIESRPLREGGLGRYMFFCDLEGGVGDDPVAEAVGALRTKAENVRVLGSYPLRTSGIPGA
ncbi:MAG: prephenate dehydratase [Solirubrobacterales bacterium]|nr:prephenate dehydratase [Solirubrobacterales bacterium]